MEKLSVPPGFVSLMSFTLKKAEHNEAAFSSVDFGNEFEAEPLEMDTASNIIDISKFNRSLRHRPWILRDKLDYNPEESNSEEIDMNCHLEASLPKGVIHGCSSCSNCVKVSARWRPEESCIPAVEEAPVFYPSEEEFKDTLKYVESIQPQAKKFGICRIVPPPSWQPPCLIDEKTTQGKFKFNTHIQRIDELQHTCSKRKLGLIHDKMKGKRRRTLTTGTESGSDEKCSPVPDEDGSSADIFIFERGPQFTLESFKKYADDFKMQYFCYTDSNLESTVSQELREPSVDNIEGEYWRVIENPSEEIEVLFVDDVETRVFGSGFPSKRNPLEGPLFPEYEESGWNLNNTPLLPGSLLAFESNHASAVLRPRLCVGMCFSSLCWKVKEHDLYSLSYIHWGAPRAWYAVPWRYFLKFEEVMKKTFPALMGNPELLHKLVSQLSPSILKREGIPVYRCIQYPREFILVSPGSYHTGFDCGFNCSEESYFAPFDWLPHGQNVVELYSEKDRKTLISHDKLLLGAATEAVKAQWELSLLRDNSVDNLRWRNVCGKDGILAKVFKWRVKQEGRRREFLCNSSQSRKMEKDFDFNTKRECCICFFDLHLSATACPCSPDRYSCLNHAKQLCSCAWSAKLFLFRYELDELNILVDALEGKLSAVYKWAKEYIGLTLHSYSSKEPEKSTSHGHKSFSSAEKADQSQFDVHGVAISNGKSRVLPKSKDPVIQRRTCVINPNERENATAFSVKRMAEKSHVCPSDVIVLSDEED